MHRAALLFVGFYGILLAERRCPASAAVMLPPSRHIVPRQEEVQFLSSSGRFECFYMRYLKEEIHYGYFEYCFFRTEPSGYSHHRCYQCDMDDLEGCLSRQTSGKALF